MSARKSREKPRDEPRGKSRDKPRVEPRGKSRDKPRIEPPDKPGNKSRVKPGDKPGDKSPVKPGDKPRDKSGDKPHDKSGDKPHDKSGDKPHDKAREKPDLDHDAVLSNPRARKPESEKEEDPIIALYLSLLGTQVLAVLTAAGMSVAVYYLQLLRTIIWSQIWTNCLIVVTTITSDEQRKPYHHANVHRSTEFHRDMMSNSGV